MVHAKSRPFSRGLAALAALALSACGGGGSGGTAVVSPPPPTAPAPVSVSTTPVFSALRFNQPLAALQAPGDPTRWFVVERRGTVWVFDNDPQVTTRQVFIDVTSRLFSASPEAGLLGMAFHPDFASNGQFFLSYTRSGAPLESVVARYSSSNGGASADPATEDVILTVLQDFANHNGGHIAFGPDGFLYAGFGDGGSSNDPNDRAQTPSTLLGKLLRVDVDGPAPYGVPLDNPNRGNALCVQGFGGAACPEIFASGLRNPWRFSFDRINGELWLGDVGQRRFEEVNRVLIGQNLGWRIREGSECQTPPSNCMTMGLTDPVFSYGRDAGASVTGGFVYRGPAIPALQARYVFGDFVSGRIWALPPGPGDTADAELLIDTAFGISSFAQGDDGELLIIDYTAGALHQIIQN